MGAEVQLDVLQRAVDGHPKLELVWRAWRAAGGEQVEPLLEMLEEAAADGMFGARAPRPGGAAWAALGTDDDRGAASAGPTALATRQEAAQVAPATQHQQAPPDQRRCYGCGQAGHIQRNCKRRTDGGRGQGEQAELLQAVRELVAELRGPRGQKPKNGLGGAP